MIFIGYSQLLTISRSSTSNIANQIHGFTIDYEYLYTKNNYYVLFMVVFDPYQPVFDAVLNYYIVTSFSGHKFVMQ